MKNIVLTVFLFISLHTYNLVGQQTVGLFQNTQEAYLGYTLFPTTSDEVFLIDNCGKIINKWLVSAVGYGPAFLLPNGALLKSIRVPMNSFPAGGGEGKIERYSWDGNLEWQMEYNDEQKIFHHDMVPLPNGNILFLAWEQKTIEACEAVGRENIPNAGLWSETIVEIKPIGSFDYEIVWKWDMWDHLIQDVNNSLINYGSIADNPNRLNINLNDQENSNPDWLHFNSIDYNQNLDQIIVSSRSLNEIFIIDHSTTTEEASGSISGNAGKGGDILFRWGNPINYNNGSESDQQLYAQHNAQWIPSIFPGGDNILVFNNEAGIPSNASHSSIIEITPSINNYNYDLSNSIFLPEGPSWEYTSNPSTLFYSSRIASTQRLQNGNTLINEGEKGRFFEVDNEGQIYWEYVNPVNAFGPIEQTVNPSNNQVFSMQKYALTYEGFNGRNLTPGEPIELNSYDYSCTTISTQTINDTRFKIVNPAREELYILAENNGKYNLAIFDLTGNKVHQSIESGNATIDIRSLHSSTYFIRIDNSVIKVLILK